MKKQVWILLAILPWSLTGCNRRDISHESSAPSPSDTVAQPVQVASGDAGGGPAKEALNLILDLAKAGDCETIAPLLAYKSGADAWKRGMHYNVLEERLEAEKECAKLEVIVAGLQHLEFLEFSTDVEREGEWLIWIVKLSYEDGTTEEKAFAFLNVSGIHLLGDID
ncbi:MAG: hypothetical protein RLZZ165_1593 [Bacteroidota bacterium]|jgi:hypothetical protein